MQTLLQREMKTLYLQGFEAVLFAKLVKIKKIMINKPETKEDSKTPTLRFGGFDGEWSLGNYKC